MSAPSRNILPQGWVARSDQRNAERREQLRQARHDAALARAFYRGVETLPPQARKDAFRAWCAGMFTGDVAVNIDYEA